MKSLVVDDEPTSRLLLQSILARYGECHTAADGRSAVEAFRAALESSARYDLICMDIMMPDTDGHAAVKTIRVLEQLRGVPRGARVKIIMTTALDDKKDVNRAVLQGCDGYLLKPVDTTSLLDYLRSFRLIAQGGNAPADAETRRHPVYAGLLETAVASYRSALEVMAKCGVQACPPVGFALQQNLAQFQAVISAQMTPGILRDTAQGVENELEQWGQAATEYYGQRARDAKELLLVLARTAEVVGQRDQRYGHRFQEFTGQLKAVADLHDLAQMRDSLLKSAGELQACAQAMVEESRRSVAQLREQVSTYQANLEEAEQLAGTDVLTGVDNRRRVESALQRRIVENRPFSVAVIDLNGFKLVNDSYGHAAGDDLLKQFAAELKSAIRTTDVVGRWGGDEFILVMDGDVPEADRCIKRCAPKLFREFAIRTAGGTMKVKVSASIGLTGWQTGETLRSLLDRADTAMYREKRAAEKAGLQAAGQDAGQPLDLNHGATVIRR